jgi:hypothetical protein
MCLAVLMVLTILPASVAQATDSREDGEYTIPVRLWHASSNQPSMGNNAIEQETKLVVADGAATLHLYFKPLTFLGMTGYLSQIDLLNNITFNANNYPVAYDLIPATVLTTFDVVDQFNHPDSTDPKCAGKPYPQEVTVPITLEQEYTWVHVYVPVMGSMGFGDQVARIKLDWSSLSKVEEESIEITAFDPITLEGGSTAAPAYEDATAVIAHLNANYANVAANEGMVSVPVTAWTDSDGYNSAVTGSYTFTATLGEIPAGYTLGEGVTATAEVVVTDGHNSIFISMTEGSDPGAQVRISTESGIGDPTGFSARPLMLKSTGDASSKGKLDTYNNAVSAFSDFFNLSGEGGYESHYAIFNFELYDGEGNLYDGAFNGGTEVYYRLLDSRSLPLTKYAENSTHILERWDEWYLEAYEYDPDSGVWGQIPVSVTRISASELDAPGRDADTFYFKFEPTRGDSTILLVQREIDPKPASLAPGTYTVPIHVWHYRDSGVSMSNGCFVNMAAVTAEANGRLKLTLDLQPMTSLGAFLGAIWYFQSEADKQEFWDGGLDPNDESVWARYIHDVEELAYYPSTNYSIKVSFFLDDIAEDYVWLYLYTEAMGEDNKMPAKLKIHWGHLRDESGTPVQIDREIDLAPLQTVLEEAKGYTDLSGYTEKSAQTLLDAIAAAEAALEDPSAITLTQRNGLISALRKAIRGLAYGIPDGEYDVALQILSFFPPNRISGFTAGNNMYLWDPDIDFETIWSQSPPTASLSYGGTARVIMENGQATAYLAFGPGSSNYILTKLYYQPRDRSYDGGAYLPVVPVEVISEKTIPSTNPIKYPDVAITYPDIIKLENINTTWAVFALECEKTARHSGIVNGALSWFVLSLAYDYDTETYPMTRIDRSRLQSAVEAADASIAAGADERLTAETEAYVNAATVLEDVVASQAEIDAAHQALQEVLNEINAGEPGTIEDGEYTLPVSLWHASSDQASMGNNALEQTAKLGVEDGQGTLQLTFKPLEFMGLTGYLSQLDLLSNIEFNENNYPVNYNLLPATVLSTYDVVDQFNHPDSTDPNCAGKPYPKEVTVPVTPGQEYTWVHVYVPVMGSMGFGDQVARIKLDWSNLTEMGEPEPDETGELTVAISGDGSVTLNDTTVISADYTASLAQGDTVTLKATANSGSTFLYWQDAATDSVLTTSAAYTTVMGSGIKVTAVFAQAVPDQYTVTFKDKTGTILSTQTVAAGEAAEAPAGPSLIGYNFSGWDKSFSAVTSDLIVTAVYARQADTYAVTVEGGTIAGNSAALGAYQFNTKVIVEAAEAEEGLKFAYWEHDGRKINLESTYVFYMPKKDIVVSAVYVPNDSEVDRSPFITMVDVQVDTSNNSILFMARRNVTEGYSLVESGILLVKGTDYSEELTVDSANVIRGKVSNSTTDQFAIRKTKVVAGDSWYGRAYMILKAAGGQIVTVYGSDTDSGTL